MGGKETLIAFLPERRRAADILEWLGEEQTAERAVCEDVLRLAQMVAEADDLLRRLSEWDHLPVLADGPFWLHEIARVRKAMAE